MSISNWSTTANNNNSAPPDGAPEGMYPSAVNDTVRQIMADVRSYCEDGGWFDWGENSVYVSGTQFAIDGDVTSRYYAGRRVRAVGATTGTIYGVVSTATYSSPSTTVTVAWDSGNLEDETLTISLGLSPDVFVIYYGTSAAEIAAGVTPTNYFYPEGNVLRYGATGDGVTDDTAAIQAAFDTASGGPSVIFPPGTYISDTVTPSSNTKIIMEPGAVLKDAGALGTNDRLLVLFDVTNIHIVGYGAKVQMDRSDYATGEQRHGVYIYQADDITIEGLESSDSGGDGFYIGAGDAANVSTNVNLVRCKADNNRRQGLSITSGKHIHVVDSEFTNTTGTAPSAGIDIEPNASTDILEDIQIIRPRCIGNDGAGILLFLNSWAAATNYADILIDAPYTEDNGNALISSLYFPGISVDRMASTAPCDGVITIRDAVCVDEERAGIHVWDWDKNGPRVDIIRPTVINPNQAAGSTGSINGGIILYNSTTYTSAPGNVYIESPNIVDDDDNLDANTLVPIRIQGAWADTLITNPRAVFAGVNPILPDTSASPTVISDKENVYESATGETPANWRWIGRTVTNQGATGTITHNLPAAVVGVVLDFALAESQEMRIDPDASEWIYPTGSAGGKYITASVRGSRVRLRCRETGSWDMENVVGTWTSE